MNTALAPLPPLPCRWCGDPLTVRGDGPFPVCRTCLLLRGRAAADPWCVPLPMRIALEERSLDVVALDGAAWRWTSTWPRQGEHQLMNGGRA